MILLSGPCVIESSEQLDACAKALMPLANNANIDFYFKASFDKANRTSIHSYRGVGLEKGLEMLLAIKQKYGYKLITDIHEAHTASSIASVVDMIQIPAFLCRQTDLIVAVASTNAKVNIKKGQFMAPRDMEHVALKAVETRGGKEASYDECSRLGIYLTERGASFGYNNLVVDMRSLVIMREFAPVIFDATHSVQMPGGGACSGGDSSFVPPLARAAAAVGVDGFFMESHIDPAKALSDGPNMVKSSDMQALVEKLLEIGKIAST